VKSKKDAQEKGNRNGNGKCMTRKTVYAKIVLPEKYPGGGEEMRKTSLRHQLFRGK
jgi:hypothetical protein